MKGKRVMATHGWLPGQLTTRANQSAPYSLHRGDLGTAVEETDPSSGVWWVVFDKDRSVEVKISTLFMELAPEPVVKAAAPQRSNTCYCEISTLMKVGCMCGAVSRYVEPHLRKMVN